MALPAASRFVRAAFSAALLPRDGGVLQALRAEIEHELSTSPSPRVLLGGRKSVGSFAVKRDEAGARDVVLTKERGDDVAVSALLGPLIDDGESVDTGNVFMKVCVEKKRTNVGSPLLLLFDCEVWESDGVSDFAVRRVRHFSPTSEESRGSDSAKWMLRCNPRDKLHQALKEYLADKGINTELTTYLIQHLQEKEQYQYLTFLQKLEATIGKEA